MNMKLTFISLLLILLRLGAVMPIQHATSERKWDLLLKTIGVKDFEVMSVTDDKIIIKTAQENLKNLRKLLNSKDTLQKNTLHALFCNNPKATRGTYNNAINIKDNEWFKKVVSDEFIKQNQLSDVFDAMKTNVQFDEELLTITLQFTLPDTFSYLMFRLSLVKLQSAITDGKTLAKILTGAEPPVAAHSNASLTPFAKVMSKIIPHEDNFTVNFVINNGAFAQTLQASIDDGEEAPIIASDLNGLFMIDKQYLMKYLAPLFNGLVFSEEEKIPIVFHAKQPENEVRDSTHDINMLIDTSSSMGKNFATYKDNIKQILDKFENIPNWQIQMVKFSTYSFGKFFAYKNGDSIADVKRYVDSFAASGTTRLYCTVNETLVDIRKKFANAIDLFSTLMVFTDGDNNEGCTENDVFDAASHLKVIPQFNMYAIGFGVKSSEFQNFFQKLTEAGGFVHIKLDDPNGMTQLQQYIDILTQKINVWEILQGELKLSVSRVPEGDVFILDPATKSDVEEITFIKNDQVMKLGTDDINCTRNVARTASII